MHVRYFTPEEAKAQLPHLKPLLADLRDAFHEYRFARQQVEELRAMYDEDPADVEDHPLAAEARRWRTEMDAQGQRVQSIVDEITAMGVDVKDPLLGLVDFFARRKTGETVLLCYRDDEDTIRYWHPVETGFAGRRPLEEL